MSITTLTTQQERNVAADLGYRVVATLDSHLLPRMREALKGAHRLSVVVSTAVSWSDNGMELCYRGVRCTVDRKVARVEITCTERNVDRIVNAIERVLTRDGSRERAAGAVVAFPITLASGLRSASAA